MKRDTARVLVVDDDEDILDAMVRFLSAHGFSMPLIQTSWNGAQASSFLHKNAYDLVITDYRMPVCDGMEFIKNNIGRGTFPKNVVMVSGDDSAKRDLPAGISFVSKGRLLDLEAYLNKVFGEEE